MGAGSGLHLGNELKAKETRSQCKGDRTKGGKTAVMMMSRDSIPFSNQDCSLMTAFLEVSFNAGGAAAANDHSRYLHM